MLGDRIKLLRQKNNLTQKELATKLKLSHQTIGSWERDRTEPSAEHLKKLAQIFDVSVDYLVGYKIDIISKDRNYTRYRKDILKKIDDSTISDEEMKEILTFIDFIKHRDGDRSN
ncbi:helix-turn-helix domain-containing protein [Enterococcus sp. AZ163]|uniref:helix-turn-helix domain-containing protein n=1 Tax=Enterococcus sp. AZ163 TaxID=2774638 RepID=UPI003D2E86C6